MNKITTGPKVITVLQYPQYITLVVLCGLLWTPQVSAQTSAEVFDGTFRLETGEVMPWYRAAFGEGPLSRRWSAHWWEWARRNLAVASTPYIEQFEGPVLWFLAGLDENVPLVPTRAALDRAFSTAPGDDHEIVVLKGALHSFLIPSPDGPPRFAEGFFDRMGVWMEDRGFSETTCWER